MSLFESLRLPAAPPAAPVGPLDETALHLAVQEGDIAAARKAFEKGASTGVFDIQGQTPLSRAAEKGDADMVRFLLAHGAEKEIDHAGSSGTALGMAAMNGHLEVMGILLGAGADIDAPNGDGATPLMQAVFGARAAAAQFLLARGANANAVRDGDETVLHLAARAGNGDILRALFAKGAAKSIDSRTKTFLQTPLHIAALTQQEVSTQVLLEMGARADIPNFVDDTPLDIAINAASNGKTRLIRLLVEEGHADLRGIIGATNLLPLHVAVLRNKCDAVRELVRLGADPERGDKDGNTALHLAAEKGHKDIAAWLVSTGMNPKIKNKAGQSPLLLARLADNDAMAALLRRAENDYVARNKRLKFQGFAPR